MTSFSNCVYEFDDFRLDPKKRVLRLRDELVPLTPKAFEMLLVLVQSHGALMTKEELMKAVWADSFVEESNLTQVVFVLRKALGETADRRYILTVQGKGYRFAADVKVDSRHGEGPLPVGAGAVGASSEAIQPEAVQPKASYPEARYSGHPVRRSSDRTSSRKRWLSFSGALAILLLGAAAGTLRRSGIKTPPQEPRGRVMLAVLPFQNLTGDAAQDYLSDGMTEEMISQMGNLDPQHLSVNARTSVMHYKNSQAPLDQIGRELAVQYVLEGSIRRDAEKVRITAQLVQMKDQTHVWARQYDRDLSSLLVLESEIAREISDEIQLTLGGRSRIVRRASRLTLLRHPSLTTSICGGDTSGTKERLRDFIARSVILSRRDIERPQQRPGLCGLGRLVYVVDELQRGSANGVDAEGACRGAEGARMG